MNKKIILTSFTLLFLLTSSIFSQLQVRESFNYAIGSSMDTLLGTAGNGWAGPWNLEEAADPFATNIGLISDTGLDYGDLNYEIPNVANNVTVSTPGGWQAARWNRMLSSTWPDEAGKSYWMSFLFQADSTPTGNTYYLLKLYNQVNADSSSELVAVGKGGGGTTYSCGSGWPGGAGDDVSSIECEGGPIWMVMKVNMSGDEGVDRTFLWIDPDPSVEPDTADADVRRDSEMNDGFNRVALECGGEDARHISWDEIRIGTSYGDVSSLLTNVVEYKNTVPETFSLEQNYPNPFNPSTKIQFNLSKQSNVTLKVYDLLGREVANLLDNSVKSAGIYSVTFDATNLPSGMYIYKVQADGFSQTKKMLLLK